MKTTKDSRIALLSVILGDGHIDRYGSGQIVHSTKQKDFLEWKARYLKRSGIHCGSVKDFNNNGYPACKMYISVSKYGKLLRRIVYSKGYKNIYQRKLLNRLKPAHLAIWYMDDGGLSQKKRNGKVHANDLIINTHTSKENNQVLIDYFYEVWRVSFTQCLNKGKYRLRCGTHQARIFLDIVREFVSQVPSMSHKLHTKSESLARKGVGLLNRTEEPRTPQFEGVKI